MVSIMSRLKPQDVVVLVKLAGYAHSVRPSYPAIGKELSISPSEIYGSVKRLQSSGLLYPSGQLEGVASHLADSPIVEATIEFLVHAVKYVFPPVYGREVRGMPTSYGTEPLNQLIVVNENEKLPVWPYSLGKVRGFSFAPLYKTVPEAASRDKVLYERLALIDAIRSGGAREGMIAERELVRSLKEKYGKSQY